MRDIPDFVPTPHRRYLENFIQLAIDDERIVGVAVGGSYLTRSMDEYSDVDLVIAVEPDHYDAVMNERMQLAESAGKLLAAFTGEHVGEPRLLICLYNDPLLHVDLKFVNLDDTIVRVEDPEVLWERDDRITNVLLRTSSAYPEPDHQWIEDRYWVWAHYIAVKIGRGELFEALDGFAFLRKKVLGPLCLINSGKRPSGVRNMETLAPNFAVELRETIASHDARECLCALRSCIKLYRTLRLPEGEITWRSDAELAVVRYIDKIERGVG